MLIREAENNPFNKVPSFVLNIDSTFSTNPSRIIKLISFSLSLKSPQISSSKMVLPSVSCFEKPVSLQKPSFTSNKSPSESLEIIIESVLVLNAFLNFSSLSINFSSVFFLWLISFIIPTACHS